MMTASRRSWMFAALAVFVAGLVACSRPAPVKGTFVLEPPLPPAAANARAVASPILAAGATRNSL